MRNFPPGLNAESEIYMFDNIGSKIKSWAKIVCWVGIVISVITSLTFMENAAFLGLMLLTIGPLVSWVASLFLYGFGELIEKTTEIAENTRCSNTKNENISNNHNDIKLNNHNDIKSSNHNDIKSNNNPKTKKCPHCGTQYDFDYPKCPNCGYQVRIIKNGEIK